MSYCFVIIYKIYGCEKHDRYKKEDKTDNG